MGLFGKKMTFDEAVAILSDFGADKKEKDKAVKAMDRFPRSERFACSALLWLQKGNPEAAALSLCVLPGENLTDEIIAVASLPVVFERITAECKAAVGHEACLLYTVTAYLNGWGTEPDRCKAAEILRSMPEQKPDSDVIRRIESLRAELLGSDAEDKMPAADSTESGTADTEAVCADKVKTVKFGNGDVYEGEMKNGKPHGKGKYTSAKGWVYTGDFADGCLSGKGCTVFANGGTYTGDYKKNVRTGQGRSVYPGGGVYEGGFLNNEQSGYGVYTYKNGDVYSGEWLHGKFNGKGRYASVDGWVYDGDWQDDVRSGHGIFTMYATTPVDNEEYIKYSYDGEWKNGKKHGHGIYVEGDPGFAKMDKVYEGEWQDGKRTGRFVWYHRNSKGGRYIDFYENGKAVESCIPYDENILTVEDARRKKAASRQTSERSAADRTAPAYSRLDASSDPLFAQIIEFARNNPDKYCSSGSNEQLRNACNALISGDGLGFIFGVKRSKGYELLGSEFREIYSMLKKLYKTYPEEVYRAAAKVIYTDDLKDLSVDDAKFCLYLFDEFIPHGRDYEAMARCCYRLGDVKAASKWMPSARMFFANNGEVHAVSDELLKGKPANTRPYADEILAFRYLQKAQKKWDNDKYVVSVQAAVRRALERLDVIDCYIRCAENSGKAYRLDEIKREAEKLRAEVNTY